MGLIGHRGAITGIQYAVGTSSVTQDVLDWTNATDMTGRITAKGFVLSNNGQYYIFVKAKSTSNGTDFWSDPGVSSARMSRTWCSRL